jgi:hypothetical protein
MNDPVVEPVAESTDPNVEEVVHDDDFNVFVKSLDFKLDEDAPADRQLYRLEKAMIKRLREKGWPVAAAKDTTARQLMHVLSHLVGSECGPTCKHNH